MISAQACCKYCSGTPGFSRRSAASRRERMSNSSQDSRFPVPGAISSPWTGTQLFSPSWPRTRASQSASEKLVCTPITHPYLHILRSLIPLYPASPAAHAQVQPNPTPGESERVLEDLLRVLDPKL